MEQPEYPENQIDVPQHQEGTSTPVVETCEQPKQPYQCDRCGRVFFSKSAIKAHIEVVHDGLKCTCEICGATMKWKANLKVHMRKMHNVGDPPIIRKINRKCQHCNILFISNSSLAEHIRAVHKEDPFKCKICGETFSTGEALSGHKLEHPEFVRYTCSVCGLRYMTSYPFQLHIKKTGHQQNTSQTNVVPEIMQKDQGLERVDQQQTASQTNVVAESMQNNKDLKKTGQQQTKSQVNVVPESIHIDHALEKTGHQQTAPENTQNNQGLEKAGHHETASQQNVVSETINNDEGMVCPKCNSTFVYYHAFRMHVSNVNGCSSTRVKHGPRRKIPRTHRHSTQCIICAERFDTVRELRNHSHSIHGVKVLDETSGKYKNKYPCPGCKKLVNFSQLGYHQKAHAGITDYSCDQCDYKCILEKDLRKHRLKHTGEKQFHCRFCSRQFNGRIELAAHENRLHLRVGVLPYQCNVCQKKFDSDHYRIVHQKTCKGKPQKSPIGFRCMICSAAFSNKSTFNFHRKEHHAHVAAEETSCKLNSKQSPLENENARDGDEVPQPEYHPSCPFCSEIFTNLEALLQHENFCVDRKNALGKASGSKSVGEGSVSGTELPSYSAKGHTHKRSERPSYARKAKGRRYQYDTDDDDSERGQTDKRTKRPSYSGKTEGSRYQYDRKCNGLKQEYPTTDQGEPNMSCINYCSTCGKSTAEMIRQVCPSHQVTCLLCKRVFKSDHDLGVHLTTAHLNEHVKPISSSNVCSTCGKTTEELVQEHTANHFYSNDRSVLFEFEENFKAGMPRVVFL